MIDRDSLRRVDIVVALYIDPEAEISEVIGEMDYTFNHTAIKDTEIVDFTGEV